MDEITRKKHTGEPGNGGQFGHVTHTDADIALLTGSRLENDYPVEIATIEVDGLDVHVRANLTSNPSDDAFIAFDGQYEVQLYIELGSRASVEDVAGFAVIGKRLEDLQRKQGMIPELEQQLSREIDRVEALLPTRPRYWRPGETLTPASRFHGHLDKGEAGFPEAADSVYVDEDSVQYEIQFPPQFLAEIILEEDLPSGTEPGNEGWERFWGLYDNKIDRTALNGVDRFFSERYSMIFDDGFETTDHLRVRTSVEYGPRGPEFTSLEAAAEEVEDHLEGVKLAFESGELKEALTEYLGMWKLK